MIAWALIAVLQAAPERSVEGCTSRAVAPSESCSTDAIFEQLMLAARPASHELVATVGMQG